MAEGCGAVHPETGDPCHVRGPHADHITGGYPPEVWMNEDYRPSRRRPRRTQTVRDLLDLGDRARRAKTRTRDPATSHEAARSLGDLRPNQVEVYRLLEAHGPMTHEELERAAQRAGTTQAPQGLRSRCAELVDLGFAEWTGERRMTGRGNPTQVWRVRDGSRRQA